MTLLIFLAASTPAGSQCLFKLVYLEFNTIITLSFHVPINMQLII